MTRYKEIKKCRSCGGKKLEILLDLGEMPAANAFVTKRNLNKKENKFPLVLALCKRCYLLQLKHTVNPSILFKDYHYNTSASRPLIEHFKLMARDLTEKHLSSKDELVVEFGSNDGVLLKELNGKCRVLGVDPAKNVARMAQKNGIETIVDYFGKKSANSILKKYGPAKIIVANNVFAHIDDIHDVIEGVKALLSDDGSFIFECHWAGDLIGKGGFDQIYHEHLFYYSLHSLEVLLGKSGLFINDVESVPIHGESIRVTASKIDSKDKSVKRFLSKEKKLGLQDLSTYIEFREKIKDNKEKLVRLIDSLKSSGYKIAGYGAPGKSTTLLNYLGIDHKIIDYITDTTPAKQGTYTPGTRIPIYAPDMLQKNRPDLIILLSWNYAKEILKKESVLRRKGVRFIVPVPKVRMI